MLGSWLSYDSIAQTQISSGVAEPIDDALFLKAIYLPVSPSPLTPHPSPLKHGKTAANDLHL